MCKSVKGCTESWGLHGWKVGLGRGGMEERTLERYIESEPSEIDHRDWLKLSYKE